MRRGHAGAAATAGDETRARIVEATLETIKREGILGTSARAIARTGGFNQALIFYHFGSVDDVLLAAVDATSSRRMARYEERLRTVRTLPELVAVASELHREDMQEGHIAVLAQMLAGSSSSPELSRALIDRFQPWIDLVEQAVRRVIEGTPYEQLLPTADLAFVVTALFVGIELMSHLDPEHRHDETLFRTVELMAGLVDVLLSMGATPAPAFKPEAPAADPSS